MRGRVTQVIQSLDEPPKRPGARAPAARLHARARLHIRACGSAPRACSFHVPAGQGSAWADWAAKNLPGPATHAAADGAPPLRVVMPPGHGVHAARVLRPGLKVPGAQGREASPGPHA